MLEENIKNLRKAKGLSQQELAVKLNVVRQTVSKWEKGLSVPDASMLILIAERLDTTVSILLGDKTASDVGQEDLKIISEKLEIINLQLAKREREKTAAIRLMLFGVCIGIAAVFAVLVMINGQYLQWDFSNPELAVAGTILHGFEFVFVRLAPVAFIASAVGIALTYKRQ